MIKNNIEGTPFTHLKDEDKGHAIALGLHMLTQWEKDKNLLPWKTIMSINWNFMTSAIATICDKVIEQKTADHLAEAKKLMEEQNNG